MFSIIVSFVKGALGIKSTVAVSTLPAGAGFMVWGWLIVWFILIAAFIKVFNSAFKGSSSENLDPVEDAKKMLIKKQKQEQDKQRALIQAQQRKNVVIDRVINK